MRSVSHALEPPAARHGQRETRNTARGSCCRPSSAGHASELEGVPTVQSHPRLCRCSQRREQLAQCVNLCRPPIPAEARSVAARVLGTFATTPRVPHTARPRLAHLHVQHDPGRAWRRPSPSHLAHWLGRRPRTRRPSPLGQRASLVAGRHATQYPCHQSSLHPPHARASAPSQPPPAVSFSWAAAVVVAACLLSGF